MVEVWHQFLGAGRHKHVRGSGIGCLSFELWAAFAFCFGARPLSCLVHELVQWSDAPTPQESLAAAPDLPKEDNQKCTSPLASTGFETDRCTAVFCQHASSIWSQVEEEVQQTTIEDGWPVRHLQVWYAEPWDVRRHFVGSIRLLVSFVQGERSIAIHCPLLELQTRLLDIELKLQDLVHDITDVTRELVDKLISYSRYILSLRKSQVPASYSEKPRTEAPGGTSTSFPGGSLSMDAGQLLRAGELRVLSSLRTWFVYYLRLPSETTDNNCEGQWCFLWPCHENCPDELCFDNRIDWIEVTSAELNYVLDALLDDEAPWPRMTLGDDKLWYIRGARRSRFMQAVGDTRYSCKTTPDSSPKQVAMWAAAMSANHGCVPLSIAMELVCSAGDALYGRFRNAVARLFLAAMTSAICVDCLDNWQLPVPPGGLWHAMAKALETAVEQGLLESEPAPRATPHGIRQAWWRRSIQEALNPLALKWQGPELDVCPLILDGGAALSCNGIELSWGSRLANAVARPIRHFLRACRSSLQYQVKFLNPTLFADCSNDRTLVLLPHADLIGHLINGIQWFLPLLWYVFAELGGQSRVAIAVVDAGWKKTGTWKRFNDEAYESWKQPRFFFELLPLLSDAPVQHYSKIVERTDCGLLCYRKAVWGYVQLSAHKERFLPGGVPRPGTTIYQDGMHQWISTTQRMRDALAVDYFVPSTNVRLGPLSDAGRPLAKGHRLARILVIQRQKHRHMDNIDEIIYVLESAPSAFGLQPLVVVVGERGVAAWSSMSALSQLALARQADILVGPSGNELGLIAFMRRGMWALELMPPPVHKVNQTQHDVSDYELNNCGNAWDATPGSLVGHTAYRAGVHHLCMRVQTTGNIIYTNLLQLDAPHWRQIPSIHVPADLVATALQRPLAALAVEDQKSK